MKHAQIKRAALAAALLAGNLAHAATGGKMQALNEKIEVASTGGQVVVTMHFDNRGSKAVHVPKSIAKDGQLFGKHFELTVAATGAEVPYIGPMVKRGPYGPDDYVEVKPNSKLSSKIDISRAYEFLPGEHAYQLRYAGNYVADLKQVSAVTPVAIAAVTFKHKR